MAKSAQDRRVYTPSTSGAVRDRRPGHSSHRTVGGVDRPDHPGTTRRAARWARPLPCGHRRRADLFGRGQVLLRYHDERHWLRAAPSRVGHLFPRLLSQAACNRRLRAVAELMEAALRWLAAHTGHCRAAAAAGWHPGGVWQVADHCQTVQLGRLGRLWPRHLAPLLLLGQPAAAGHHPRRDRDGVRVGQPQTGRRTPGRVAMLGGVPANRPAPGTLLVGDKGFAGREFQTALAGLELGILGPARTDEPDPGSFRTGCGSGSRRSSGLSSTSSAWTGTAAASRPGCGRGWCSACSRSMPRSGSTGRSAPRSSVP